MLIVPAELVGIARLEHDLGERAGGVVAVRTGELPS
jgi:hypothetical protein